MIFKVYYQENRFEVSVRENTKSLYVEASNEREVRHHLKDRNYNIEYVQLLEDHHLEYEQAGQDYEVERLDQ